MKIDVNLWFSVDAEFCQRNGETREEHLDPYESTMTDADKVDREMKRPKPDGRFFSKIDRKYGLNRIMFLFDFFIASQTVYQWCIWIRLARYWHFSLNSRGKVRCVRGWDQRKYAYFGSTCWNTCVNLYLLRILSGMSTGMMKIMIFFLYFHYSIMTIF